MGDQIAPESWDRFVADFRAIRCDQVCGEFYAYERVLRTNALAVSCSEW